jgi:hypothetical protein
MCFNLGRGRLVRVLRYVRPIHAIAKWLLPVIFLALFPNAQAQVPYLNQEVQVHDLPLVTAKSHDPSDVLLASLETILHDSDVCCGKNSALVDSLALVDATSLKDVAGKLEGRHLLSDGRPILVKINYLSPEMVNADNLIHMILDQHAALLEWNSHLYVVHGVEFIWEPDGLGHTFPVIRKLMLTDTRYSDSRREAVFTRGVDDAAKLERLLSVQVAN